MKKIRVQASLRKAVKEDLFSPVNIIDPALSENILCNTDVFRWCPAVGRFLGIQRFHRYQKITDVLMPLMNGCLFVLNEKIDAVNDEYVFGLVLEVAEPQQLKETEKTLRFGLAYFVMLDDGDVDGPLFLNQNTDINKLAKQLKKQQVYLVSEQQTFIRLRGKESA